MINMKTDTPWGPRSLPKPRPRKPVSGGPGGTWDEVGPHYPKGPHTGGSEPF